MMPRGREDSSSHNDEERLPKRHANSIWALAPDAMRIHADSTAGGLRNSNMWMQPGMKMPIPSPMGMMQMPPFPPMMIPMPNADPRQLEAYKIAMEKAMMNGGIRPQHVAMPSQPDDRTADSGRLNALGTSPSDTFMLREYALYEKELFEDFRTRVTEKDHFYTMVSLMERYFKGALGASARQNMTKMVQRVIDDRATSVEESRRLKHVLEAIRNGNSPRRGGHRADSSYLQRLTETHDSFVSQYGGSGKVK